MSALLTQGFRPFFLAAGLWSATALALWIVMFATETALPSRFDPLTWHIHEMLFGFVMAAVAGFLLTAIPNWTQRLPVSGAPLALLAGLWLFGRIACLVSAFVPSWLATAADLSFPVVLVAVVAREIVAGRNWRNLVMVVPVIVLGIANLLMHLEADGVAVPAGLGWRLGLAAVIILISVVAGRIVPSFTRNWLTKRRVSRLPAVPGWIDRAALGALHTGLIGWAFLPGFSPIGLLLLLAATLNLWRLSRWRGGATAAEPLLLILHIGYFWVVLGTAMLGLTLLDADLPQSAAVHALTAGAIGTMILAVMTRVARGHSGRDLSADRVTSLIYILVTLAAITRVAAALAPGWRCRCSSSRHVFGFPPSAFSYSSTGRCCFCRAKLASDARRLRGAASGVGARTILGRINAQAGRMNGHRRSSVIIRSSDEVPRVTALKRFPAPRNFGVSPKSRIERGRTWSVPARATRVKALDIYRYDMVRGLAHNTCGQ